jgi:PPOX class F420-dependent enzyme/OxyR family protein
MSAFTENEIAYLRSQRLGRLATVDERGEPHVVPVAFAYNAAHDTIDIGGHGIGRSKKFRDVGRDGRVAFVVDDVPPAGQVRGIEVRGSAETLGEGGKNLRPNFDDEVIRIRPTRIISWGIEGSQYQQFSRNVE